MEKINNNLKLPPLAGFVVWILKSNNIDFNNIKCIFPSKISWNKNVCTFYLNKNHNLEHIYYILKDKLNKSEEFIKLQKDFIVIENQIELIKVANYNLSFLEKIKENLLKLFK